MSYWTWKGHSGDLPTLHVFDYGVFNLWEDGLTTNEHWADKDPPDLRPEVLEDLKAWGGEWHPNSLEIRFPDGNDHGATMWKLKYGSETTRPYHRPVPDADGVVRVRGTGLGDIL